jgi:predicted permease
LLLSLLPGAELASSFRTTPDWRILLFTLVVSVLTCVVFSVAPALIATRGRIAEHLHQGGSRMSADVGSGMFRKAMIIVQMALSLVLLFGAGFFSSSLAELLRSTIGVDTGNLYQFEVSPQLGGRSPAESVQLLNRLSEEFSEMPGAVSATSNQVPLFADSRWTWGVYARGYNEDAPSSEGTDVLHVGSNFFRTLGVPLLHGRGFSARNPEKGPQVAVVSESFANKFFGTSNAVGKRFGYSRREMDAVEVIGVTPDIHTHDVRIDPLPIFYLPVQQSQIAGWATFFVKMEPGRQLELAEVRAVVRGIAPEIPVSNFKPTRNQIAELLFVERSVSYLCDFFALLSLVLASIGLYGVIAYQVTRRTPEIGIRKALGAEAHQILRSVLSEVVVLALAGMALAAPMIYAALAWMKSLASGADSNSESIFALAAGVLVLTALIAALGPSLRAARVDPVSALRGE